jgi:predicted nucleotide-binding protein (sugar kinase/HSP70/actin superfamily)
VRVGVVGDAFTRVHEYGMGEIFNTVERMEGVVMIPPSWYDFVSYGAERRVSDFIRKKQYINALKAKFGSHNINSWKRKIQALATTYSDMFAEPDNAMLTEYARPYVNVDVAPVIPSMFVGKAVDFLKNKNIHGLINAYGFNCSLGKISTACINRIRRDYRDIPMLTVIDDGLQQTNIQTRVEAFMEQARHYKTECE